MPPPGGPPPPGFGGYPPPHMGGPPPPGFLPPHPMGGFPPPGFHPPPFAGGMPPFGGPRGPMPPQQPHGGGNWGRPPVDVREAKLQQLEAQIKQGMVKKGERIGPTSVVEDQPLSCLGDRYIKEKSKQQQHFGPASGEPSPLFRCRPERGVVPGQVP